MENGSVIRNIEQTFYAQLSIEHHRIRVTTKNGWQSDICDCICEFRKPGGLHVSKGSESDKYFVPFDAIDHIQIFD